MIDLKKPISQYTFTNYKLLNLIVHPMGGQVSQEEMFLSIIEGETQSHELFDFQKTGVVLEQPIQSPSYILSDGNHIRYQLSKESDLERTVAHPTTVFEISKKPHKQISIRSIGNSLHSLWRVIQQNEAFPLQVGDVLKIGKIKIQLKRIVTTQSEVNEEETVKEDESNSQRGGERMLLAEQEPGFDTESVNTEKTNCDRCRVCFGNENHKADPLVCLCKCSGSIKFIHYNCLKDWISNNVTRREDEHCNFYSFLETCCELCKYPIPSQFEHRGRVYSLLDFKTFSAPYAELEYEEVENNRKKVFRYLVKLTEEQQICIGRNNSSQVVMKDISISRTHCSLEYKGGLLLMRDKNSKFGTLVKVNRDIEFEPQAGLQLQLDSKIIKLHQKNSLLSCCCSEAQTCKVVFENYGKACSRVNPFQESASERGAMHRAPSVDSFHSSPPSLSNRDTMIRNNRPQVEN